MRLPIILLLLLLPFISSQVIQVSPSSACTCPQFVSKTSCNDYTLGQCVWNVNSSQCQEAQCNNIQSQQDCLVARLRCYWNGNTCSTFNNCSQLTSQQGLICPEQNISCYGNETNKCQNISSLSQCSTYGIGTCGEQGGYAGSDGICYWNKQIKQCSVATNCSQILSQQVCNKFIQNACYWNFALNSCQQQECSNLTTNCTFVVLNLNLDTVTPCMSFEPGNCFNANVDFFQDEQQCQTNTLLTYRWVPYEVYGGFCISCAQQNVLPKNKCDCEQFVNASNCNQSQYCVWSVGQCSQIECTAINNQYQCFTNTNCFWNFATQSCNIFESCNNINQFCLASSMNCTFEFQQVCFEQANSCGYMWEPMCNGSFSGEGFCYYNQNHQCVQLNSCNNIQNINLCNQLTKICIWNSQQSQCDQLTCENIKVQNRCTSVLKNLQTTDLQICQWNGQSCQNAQNILILPEDQCASNTLYTYFYSNSKCIKCLNYPVQLPNQCACSQLSYMNDCLQNPSCQYVLGEFAGYCADLSCQAITNQIICASNQQCFWNEYGCSNFKSCLGLLGATPKECKAQTVNCPYSNGYNCQNKYYLSNCESFNQPSLCLNQLGSDGLCIWNSTLQQCQVLSKCTQILSLKNCGVYEYACYWSDDTCKASSCSSFTTVGTCKFYYSTLNSFNPIPCQWNSEFFKCEQVGSSFIQLSSAVCYQNTAFTSRWSQYNSNQGACVSCKAKYAPNPFRCDCVQLLSEINCRQNNFCFWSVTTNTCQEQQCTSFTESVCIANPKCQWTTNGCQAFVSCSQIKGKSMGECLGQSLYCPYSQPKKSCAPALNYLQCDQFTNATDCYQQMGQFRTGLCVWMNNKCVLVDSCTFLNQQQCEVYQFYCLLIDGYYCIQKTCSNIMSKSLCNYVIDFKNQNYIQSCQWINGTCQNSVGQIAKDQETCYANSNGTNRWTSNQAGSGFCAPCNLPPTITKYNNRCSCSQYLNQNECVLPFCYWSQYQCLDNACDGINNQFACAQLKWCYWNLQNNYCKKIETQLLFCQSLKGNSSLECLSQSGNCPVSLNGVCQDRTHLQTCSSMNSQAACSNSIGQEGYCTFENQSCKVIETCSQIKIQSYCLSLQHICTWNAEFNLCQQVFCTDYTTKEDCKYIYQSINNLTLQLCEWNINEECQTASYLTLADKNKETCFIMSAGTYHWSNNSENGYCITCSLNQIQYPDTCQCSQLSEHECIIASPRCRLNQSNSCVQATCDQLLNSPSCSQMKNCMWYQGTCTQFTSCSNLKGQSALDCWAQSKMCPGISNGVCQQQSELKECSSYTSAANCPLGMPAKKGLCYWNGAQCQQIINCDSISNVTQCDALNKMCNWSRQFNKCAPYKCQDYTEQELCNYVIVNFENPYVEMCQWQNGHCMPFTGKYYRYDEQTCYENSGHTYRWITDDSLGSRCQQCFGAILVGFLVIIIIGF